MRTTGLSLLLLVLGFVGASAGTLRKPPAAPVSPVRALLQRAAKQPDKEALNTLGRAIRLAERINNRAASLAVAATAYGRGRASHKRRDYAAAERFHAVALAIRERHQPGTVAHADSLNGVAGAMLNRDGPTARRLAERALEIGEKTAPDSLAVASSFYLLGFLADDQDRAAEARDYYERSLAIREKLAPGSPELANTLNNLALVTQAQGDLEAARGLLQRVLVLREKLEPGSYYHGGVLVNLGNIAKDQDDPATAKVLYQRALIILEATAPGSPFHANCLTGIGIAAKDLGDLPEAMEFQLRALAIREKLAPGSPGVAQSLNNLGSVAHAQGDLEKAEDYWQSALAILERLAPGSLAHAAIIENLGILASDKGDLASARAAYLRALDIEEKRVPGSLAVADTVQNLGSVAHDAGDLARAREHFQRALSIYQKLAPGSLSVARSLNSLGDIARHSLKLAVAREYIQRATAIVEKLAPGSQNVASNQGQLGALALDEGDFEAARQHVERALAIQEKLAPGSLEVATWLGNLGVIAENQGDLEKAKVYAQRSLAIRKKLVPASPSTAQSLGILASLADEIGDRVEALAHLTDALRILNESAPNSLDVPVALRSMARLQLDVANEKEAAEYLRRAESLDERIRRPPRDQAPANADAPREPKAVRPEVFVISPGEYQEVESKVLSLHLAFLSPISFSRYRMWVNGRSIGPEAGFDLPKADEKGRLLDKGRLLEKGDALDASRVFERGRLLEKGEDRDALAQELPEELAALVKQPQYAHFLQIRQTVPVEDTDGEFLRIAVLVETTGGSVSDRQILRLRRPQAEQQRGSLRVLTVGISAYDHLPKLRYAAADAEALADALRGQAGVVGDLRLYRGAAVLSLTEDEATLARIRDELDRLAATTRPGDTVMVAFSGHGIAVRPPKADLAAMSLTAMMAYQAPESKFYFAPVRFDPENAAGSGLPWSEVLSKLEQIRKVAKSVWLLADCCRAAPGLRREMVATGRDLKRGIDEGGNLILVTASNEDTPSYESQELGHGIFTQAWLEVLRGEAPDLVYQGTTRRVLTLSGLQFWLDASVRRHADKAGVRQRVEFPRLEGSFSPSTPVFVPDR